MPFLRKHSTWPLNYSHRIRGLRGPKGILGRHGPAEGGVWRYLGQRGQNDAYTLQRVSHLFFSHMWVKHHFL